MTCEGAQTTVDTRGHGSLNSTKMGYAHNPIWYWGPNPKSEARNSKQIPMTKIQMTKTVNDTVVSHIDPHSMACVLDTLLD